MPGPTAAGGARCRQPEH